MLTKEQLLARDRNSWLQCHIDSLLTHMNVWKAERERLTAWHQRCFDTSVQLVKDMAVPGLDERKLKELTQEAANQTKAINRLTPEIVDLSAKIDQALVELDLYTSQIVPV